MTTVADLVERSKWIRLGWEQVAYEYAKDRSGIFRIGAKRLLELLQPSLDSSLLDVACGNGFVTFEALECVGTRGMVIGSDNAAAMVQLAQTNIEQGMTNIAFCHMDAAWLGFDDASFDNVTCAFSLFQFPDMQHSLDEMWRVLKPGGRLGLSNWGPGYFSPIASLQRDLFREFEIKQILTNPIVFKADDMKRMLYKAAFASMEMIEETQEIWFTKPEDIWAFNMDMGPFPVMLQTQLSSDQQSEIIQRFKILLGDLMTTRGIKSTFHLLYTIAEKGG